MALGNVARRRGMRPQLQGRPRERIEIDAPTFSVKRSGRRESDGAGPFGARDDPAHAIWITPGGAASCRASKNQAAREARETRRTAPRRRPAAGPAPRQIPVVSTETASAVCTRVAHARRGLRHSARRLEPACGSRAAPPPARAQRKRGREDSPESDCGASAERATQSGCDPAGGGTTTGAAGLARRRGAYGVRSSGCREESAAELGLTSPRARSGQSMNASETSARPRAERRRPRQQLSRRQPRRRRRACHSLAVKRVQIADRARRRAGEEHTGHAGSTSDTVQAPSPAGEHAQQECAELMTTTSTPRQRRNPNPTAGVRVVHGAYNAPVFVLTAKSHLSAITAAVARELVPSREALGRVIAEISRHRSTGRPTQLGSRWVPGPATTFRRRLESSWCRRSRGRLVGTSALPGQAPRSMGRRAEAGGADTVYPQEVVAAAASAFARTLAKGPTCASRED